MSEPWWKSAVIYQIYPRSFAPTIYPDGALVDTNGDGIGDLGGVRAHLDHLVWLGVDALWLSPFYRSPMADYGYDVSDYLQVAPRYGTNDDLVELVAAARERGIRVLLDLVADRGRGGPGAGRDRSGGSQHEGSSGGSSSRADARGHHHAGEPA